MSERADFRLAGSLLLTFFLTVVVYSSVSELGFVWDDRALIIDNPLIRDLGLAPQYFLNDLWSTNAAEETSGYYRPLMLLSLAIDHALFAEDPAGYHLHSLIWHLLACTALALLLRQLTHWTAVLAGVALFALHPIQSESVVWIAARNDPMSATFALLALWLLVAPSARGWRLPAAAALAGLALLAKESVLLLPGALLALDVARGQLGSLWRYVALVVGLGMALGLRSLSGVGETLLPSQAALQLALLQAPEILALIGTMIAWPVTLSTTWSIEWLALSPERFVLGVLTILGLLAGPLLVSAERQRMALAGLFIAVIFYLPAVVPIASKGLVGERYLYLPMAGLLIWLVSLVPRRMVGGLLILVPLCIMRIHMRLPDWGSERALWEAAVRDSPDPFSRAGLGHALNSDEGDRHQALMLFVSALSDRRPYLGVCGTPVTTAFNSGRPALAAQVGWWSVSRGCPQDGDFAGRMSVAVAATGDWEGAQRILSGHLDDASGRSAVVRAALYRRANDDAGYDRIATTWEGSTSLDEQVDNLLGSHGD